MKEEWKCYHLHYHRWLYVFLYGVMINPIQWVFDKGKGRICIDCTNGPDEQGSVNSYIPKPLNTKNPPKDMKLNFWECPPTWFKYAFKQVLRRILRMRITNPHEPILGHMDDIESAFRRILYHPDVAIAFAYLFEGYLIVPVSQVFGGRSSPPFYGLLADVLEVLAVSRTCEEPKDFHPLVKSCTIQIDNSTPLVTFPEDSHHPLLTEKEANDPSAATYIDDNPTLSYTPGMLAAVNNSVMSAFEVFGASGSDPRRGDCLQMLKWEREISEIFMYSGFLINTHDMTVTWPRAKREALHRDLTEILGRSQPRWISPKEMARIIGIVHSASEIAPWGNFLSFNLQNSLTKAARKATGNLRAWYTRTRIYLSQTAVRTIEKLLETLLIGDGLTWTHPICLLFDRDPTHRVYSDASYIGLGGWSADFSFLWRLTRQSLVDHGFHMKTVSIQKMEPNPTNPEGLHINPLEYIACLLNLWIALKIIMLLGPRAGGYILQLNADNMSALAWMATAARTPDPFLQGLARLGSAFLVAFARLLKKVDPTHFAGVKNIEADALSRPKEKHSDAVPSLESVIKQWYLLQMCRICLLPSELLSTIARITSSGKIEESYEEITTQLLTLDVTFLPVGVKKWDSDSTILCH